MIDVQNEAHLHLRATCFNGRNFVMEYTKFYEDLMTYSEQRNFTEHIDAKLAKERLYGTSV